MKTYISSKVNMGGIILDQPLPNQEINDLDPFLLIHHWEDEMTGGKKQGEVGVGPHPHRGFSPVTVIFDGAIHHRDSLGNNDIIPAGGVQWMNSGSGIIHSERPPKEFAENGGKLKFIQFWVNSPREEKSKEAFYHAIYKEDIPTICSGDEKVLTHVIAGTLNETNGPAKPSSELIVARIEGKKEGSYSFTLNSSFNSLLYVLNGTVSVNNEEVDGRTMLVFEGEKEVTLNVKSNCSMLLLSGKPIKEPIATYGPFVMNCQREIIEALNDYQAGKMGELIEDFS